MSKTIEALHAELQTMRAADAALAVERLKAARAWRDDARVLRTLADALHSDVACAEAAAEVAGAAQHAAGLADSVAATVRSDLARRESPPVKATRTMPIFLAGEATTGRGSQAPRPDALATRHEASDAARDARLARVAERVTLANAGEKRSKSRGGTGLGRKARRNAMRAAGLLPKL